MSHKINFTYMDGKDITVYLKNEEVKKFMESIGKSEVYFDDVSGKGMWIPIDRIRYFQVERESDSGAPSSRVQTRNAESPPTEVGDSGDGGESVEEIITAPECAQSE